MRIGDYEVLGPLGAGGMGTVLRARGPDGAEVALKILKNPDSPERVARFERERRLLESLGVDAGFVPLVASGQSPSGPFIVMPLLRGGTLRARLDAGPLEVAHAIELARELATALGRAHALGIVHRDVKPENVLFGPPTASWPKGRPLLADLGLAKHFARTGPGGQSSVSLSIAGAGKGTAGYAPPEQLELGDDARPQSDVFALGCILHECLTGQPAFGGDSFFEVFEKVRSGSRERLTAIRPDAPGWLERVIERALARDPRARYADGAELARALEAGDAGDRPRGRGLLVAMAVLALVVVATAGGVAATREPRAVPPPPGPPAAPPPPEERAMRPRLPSGAPEWLATVPREEWPPLPLRKGLAWGTAPREVVNQKDGSVLLWVPADTFVMGSPFADDESDYQRPQHEVELSGHFVGKREVTNAQFARFVAETRYVTSGERSGADWRRPMGDGEVAPPELPVRQVGWKDARAYCDWAGLRLPTEAEWEHDAGWDRAARRVRRFPWGDVTLSARTERLANVADESYLRAIGSGVIFPGYDDGFVYAAPPGSFPLGAAPCGAEDMGGNVAEWVADDFDRDYYRRSAKRDPLVTEPHATNHVFRGGSYGLEWWRNQVWTRNFPLTDQTFHYVGFRVAR